MENTLPARPQPRDGNSVPSYLQPLSFIERLQWRLDNDPPKQKGLRTREKLKLAGARLLAERGIHELKAGDVSAEAGMAEGSFYLYFSDKGDLIRTVLREFQAMYFDLQVRGGGRREASRFDSIRFANLVWIAFCRANSGLIGCLYQFGESDAEFGKDLSDQNLRWHQRVLRGVRRQGGPVAAMSDPELLLVICLLGGMMDDLVRRLLISPDVRLLEILAELDATDEMLADVAALLWMRVLAPSEVPHGTLAPNIAKIAGALFPA